MNKAKKAEPQPAGRHLVIGQPFNPSYKVCGFHPPEVVRRRTDLSQAVKLLYERCVHWAGGKATFWYGFDSMARELGYSIRQAKRDMRKLERRGLISHVRRGNGQTNLYRFSWHEMFEAEVPNTAHQTTEAEVPFTAHQPETEQDDPEGPEVPFTARLEVPYRVSRCAVNGTQILQGILQEGIQQEEPTLSVLETSVRKESDDKPITRFASAKNAEGSLGASSPLTHNHSGNGTAFEEMAKELAAAEEAFLREAPITTKPWTPRDLQMVHDRASAYMEGDTPPDQFATNCQLAAHGHTAADIVALFDQKYAKKKYRPGGTAGPRTWTWFYTVIGAEFSPTERSHLPEAPASPKQKRSAKAQEKPLDEQEDDAGFAEDFLLSWVLKNRTGDIGKATRLLAVIACDKRQKAYRCRDRYMASGEVQRGFVMKPEKWLKQQIDQDFEGLWPTETDTTEEYVEGSDGLFRKRTKRATTAGEYPLMDDHLDWKKEYAARKENE